MSTPTLSSTLTEVQRGILARRLHSLLLAFEGQRAAQLQGLSQVDRASLTLEQEADDASQRAGDHEVEFSMSEIDNAEIKSITRAMQRVYDADFGRCIDCGMAIAFERLEVEPQAIRCAVCESAHERGA